MQRLAFLDDVDDKTIQCFSFVVRFPVVIVCYAIVIMNRDLRCDPSVNYASVTGKILYVRQTSV